MSHSSYIVLQKEIKTIILKHLIVFHLINPKKVHISISESKHFYASQWPIKNIV